MKWQYALSLVCLCLTWPALGQTEVAEASELQQSTQSQDSEWDEWDDWEEPTEEVSPFSWFGFAEVAAGQRLFNDEALDRDKTLRDIRVQIQGDYKLEASSLSFRGDLYYDGVLESVETQLRELTWQGNLAMLGEWGSHFDAKIGQQVLTWGTGDYLFLNDMFAKDYQSFFSGRDDEYLKAPSLSAKVSGYFDWASIDLVVTPEFQPDNEINGEYFSFFSPMLGQNIATEFEVTDANEPNGAEVALRIYKTLGSVEWAAYAYRGYNKTPEAADELGQPRYSRLNVYGMSAVRPLGAGIAKFEYAWYDAKEDSEGSNPLVPNSEQRFLLGYEQELVANLTGSVQWYLEHTQDYANLLANSYWPDYEDEQNRHVVTTQLVYRAMRQTLTLQWFNFYSPTDNDGYTRFRATYSPVDEWQVNGGMNLFYGEEPHTFYSQFKDGSNLYAAFRYFF
jgi:hypothetical protein